ncbi:MAG TPA: Hsp20/alpha crystallin family protein [Pseudonocardiaceae bacterium]|nr:Hsp20/alpha crystallin family protein [Pseudonocardiaceae bacterium]
MTTMTRYAGGGLAPDIFSWLEAALPFSGRHSMAVEEFSDDRGYVLRAELPGREPKEDITVTVADGTLTITADRNQANHEGQQTEFRYGKASRMVTLPAGVKPGEISASYDKGILEIRIPVSQPAEPYRVPVAFDGTK